MKINIKSIKIQSRQQCSDVQVICLMFFLTVGIIECIQHSIKQVNYYFIPNIVTSHLHPLSILCVVVCSSFEQACVLSVPLCHLVI